MKKAFFTNGTKPVNLSAKEYLKKNKIKSLPFKQSEPKWKSPFKKFEKYVTTVIAKLKKGGLNNKHIVNMSLIIHCFADNLSPTDCATVYFKSLQLKLQFEKDNAADDINEDTARYAAHLTSTP